MWMQLHNRLFTDRYSPQSANNAAAVSGVLLVLDAVDPSPPTSPRAALARLQTYLEGTMVLRYLEDALHGIT